MADMVKIVDASGLDYRLTAEGTILEGNWDQLMKVAKQCPEEMRKKTDRLVSIMHADDYDNRPGRLNSAVDSVAKKLDKPVKN